MLNDSEKISKIEAIIKKHKIDCGETIYQCDRIIENALEIIDGICEIVGYCEGD